MSGTHNLDGLKTQALTCIEAAYDKGYKAAKQDIVAVGNKSEYERGLNDAEKARMRIVKPVSAGGLSKDELIEIFDMRDWRDCSDVLLEYTIPEIIEKIREYDERKQRKESAKASDDEIRIGDEVYCLNPNYKYVVLGFLDNGKIFVFSGRGLTGAFPSNQVHKTGRKYPVMEILEKLNQLNESEG